MERAPSFEAHLTVEAPDAEAVARFEALCATRGLKCVVIELPEGAGPRQPMTARWHRGSWEQVRREVEDDAKALRALGLRVVRVKVEALASNPGVPRDAFEAAREPAGRYFEFHVKVHLDAGEPTEPLRLLAEPFGARLSRNARKVHGDGRAERFVTMRVYGVGRDEAEERFEALLEALRRDGHVLSNMLREYTVLDTFGALDSAWLAPPTGTP